MARHVGPPEAYPDPALTPGVALKGVTAAVVCTPGYAKKQRNVPAAVKAAVFKRYGLAAADHADYEVDHYLPLSLGGANDIKNLWPQPKAGPWGFPQKDLLESVAHSLVCKGLVLLAEVRRAFLRDWVAAYRKYVQKGA
jgi:hypothetical protein